MGQIFEKGPKNYIPYDANGWRRLSLTYLNQLNENGELVENERRRSRSNTPTVSRQSSFGSRNDLNRLKPNESPRSYRTHHQGEPVVLQEYKPSRKSSNSILSDQPLGSSLQTIKGSSRETDFPAIESKNDFSNLKTSNKQPVKDKTVHPIHYQSHKGETDGTSFGKNANYADLSFSKQVTTQSTSNNKKKSNLNFLEKKSSNDALGIHRDDHNLLATSQKTAQSSIIQSNHPHITSSDQRTSQAEIFKDEHDFQSSVLHDRYLQSGQQDKQDIGNLENRAQSPKSSTTWNTFSEDYQSSNYSNPTNQTKQFTIHNNYHPPPKSFKEDNVKLKYVPLGANDSQRQRNHLTSQSFEGRDEQYMPYKDYFMDHRFQDSGRYTYSDSGGYSRRTQRRKISICSLISYTKWIFITFALISISSTIWNSIYMQMMSKRIELGNPIQGESKIFYSVKY